MEKEYEIEIDELYVEIKLKNERLSIRSGDCYVFDYEDLPESGVLSVSSDIEIVVKAIVEELKNINHYWYGISSWKDGKHIDGDSFRAR
ncbi:hypothetical protein PDK45_22425 [Bacillus cereus]|nr:hypothetical protein [Bacillus cereus]